jgi:hypothetical protein
VKYIKNIFLYTASKIIFFFTSLCGRRVRDLSHVGAAMATCTAQEAAGSYQDGAAAAP